MPMAWTNKYRRILGFLGRVRIIVGIGIGLIAVFSFTVLTENDSLGKFVHGVHRQRGFIAPASTSMSDSKSLGCFARDTVYFVPCNGKRIRVEIKVARFANASTRRKMLLLLPGWNYADTQWCTRTRVCDEAVKRGYDVMLVEMGKSVYMDSLYPQMRADYRLHPTRTWLWDSVLKPLQKRSYFTDRGIPEDPIKTVDGDVYYLSMMLPIPSYVMGLSTGARGALLLALEHPEAFVGCAGLSGDYNPLLMKNDNLMINCLGKYDDVPWRWRGRNNIEMRVDFFKVPMYLAHGSDDRVVPMKQTESLLLAIERSEACKARAAFPKVYTAVTHHYLNEKIVQSEIVVGAGHDYIFWNQAGLKALDYFDELLMD
jgi:pimeloyl-ACP methyl ester carboxylesterase